VIEQLVAVMATSHRLARRRRLPLVELRDEELITFREGAGLRRFLDNAAAEAGFRPQVAFESNNVVRCRSLAARGLGVTILPASDAETPGAEVAAVPIVEPALARDVTLVWRESRHHSPAARAFLDVAQHAAG
jgi:DNA-binding transcriptional LysR family regulator